MAGSLAPINIGAPGFYGLNTQDSPTGLDPKFCLEAKNAVIDRSGRLAARKGWEGRDAGGEDIAPGSGCCRESQGTLVLIAASHAWQQDAVDLQERRPH